MVGSGFFHTLLLGSSARGVFYFSERLSDFLC